MVISVRRMLAACALATMVTGALLAVGSAPTAAAPPPGSMTLTMPTTSVWSQQVTLSAKITRLPRQPYPTGTVNFLLYHVETSTQTSIDVPVGPTGTAVLRYRGFMPGGTDVMVLYSGDSTYATTGATPGGIIVSKASTTTTVTSKKTIVPSGARASFDARTAKIAPATGSLAGTTTFTATSPGQTTVTADIPTSSSGRAVWAPILPDGRWTVTAAYGSSAVWNGSTSAGIEQPIGATIDQEVAGGGTTLPINHFSGAREMQAQTFTAGTTGSLRKIGLEIQASGISAIPVRITTVVAGAPSSEVLASFTIPVDSTLALRDVALPTPIPVQAGVTYAIVISTPDYQGTTWVARVGTNEGDVYPGGDEHGSFNGGSWSKNSGIDLAFRTWVSAA